MDEKNYFWEQKAQQNKGVDLASCAATQLRGFLLDNTPEELGFFSHTASRAFLLLPGGHGSYFSTGYGLLAEVPCSRKKALDGSAVAAMERFPTELLTFPSPCQTINLTL